MNLFATIEMAAPDLGQVLLETPAGEKVTYGEAFALAGRFANLLEELGVGPGDRVAVQTEKSWPAVVLYLGCLRAGAVYLPLNPAYTVSEVDYFLRDAEPVVLVAAPDRADALAPVAAVAGVGHVLTMGGDGEGSLLAAARQRPAVHGAVERAGDDLAAILYTSGTTGRSKGAMLTHDNLRTNAEALADCWRFTDADVLIHALPIFHTHGLFVATNIVLLAGGVDAVPAGLRRARDPRGSCPRATTMMGVPTFYTRLLVEPGLTREARPACGSSCPAPRRSSPRPTTRRRRAPGTPSSSATA